MIAGGRRKSSLPDFRVPDNYVEQRWNSAGTAAGITFLVSILYYGYSLPDFEKGFRLIFVSVCFMGYQMLSDLVMTNSIPFIDRGNWAFCPFSKSIVVILLGPAFVLFEIPLLRPFWFFVLIHDISCVFLWPTLSHVLFWQLSELAVTLVCFYLFSDLPSLIVLEFVFVILIAIVLFDLIALDLRKYSERVGLDQAKITMKKREKRAISRLLSYVSHEIRNPLNSLNGCLQFLQDSALSRLGNGEQDSTFKDLSQAQDSCEMIKRLCEDLLVLQSGEDSKIGLDIVSFDLGLLVKNIVEDFSIRNSSSNQHSVRIQLSTNEELGFVEGDPIRIKQILLNLLSNSRKHTTQGIIQLSVTCFGNGLYRFEVSDSGSGIPFEEQSKLFKAFHQVNSDLVGFGLGLHFCKKIARRLGGNIELVRSAPGAGSVFGFTIPLKEVLKVAPERLRNLSDFKLGGFTEPVHPPSLYTVPGSPHPDYSTRAQENKEYIQLPQQQIQPELSQQKLPQQEQPQQLQRRRGRKRKVAPPRDPIVLIVDDEHSNRMVLGRYLQGMEIPYSEAGNGAEAVERIASGQFQGDIILMEVHMAIMTGIEATRQIMQIKPQTKIIGMTSSVENHACYLVGMVDVLLKPFSTGQLKSCLRRNGCQGFT